MQPGSLPPPPLPTMLSPDSHVHIHPRHMAFQAFQQQQQQLQPHAFSRSSGEPHAFHNECLKCTCVLQPSHVSCSHLRHLAKYLSVRFLQTSMRCPGFLMWTGALPAECSNSNPWVPLQQGALCTSQAACNTARVSSLPAAEGSCMGLIAVTSRQHVVEWAT